MKKLRGNAINKIPKFWEGFCGKTRRKKWGVAPLRTVFCNEVLVQKTSKIGYLIC